MIHAVFGHCVYPVRNFPKCCDLIQAVNLNHWIRQERNEKLFFRFDGSDVRAIFTPRYISVDNFEVIERLDSLGFGPETHLKNQRTGEYFGSIFESGSSAPWELRGIDLESYDPDEYALAKILVTAAIRNHKDDYASLNKAHKEDLENLKYF